MTTPRIAFVVAVARNGVIGRDGRLPWRNTTDLRVFKATTLGKPVVMGRKTWEGLPRKPLPGRENIVITRDPAFEAPGARLAHSIAEALAIARASGAAEIAVIGGGEIFREMLPLAERIYHSEIDATPDGDTFFPPLREDEWREVSREAFPPSPGDTAGFVLRVLDRIRHPSGIG
jgi:dihydrofolate reductase